MNGIATISEEEVLSIHDILTEDFANSNDPIQPSGVKSIGLLGSAVSRQFTGLGNTYKYDTPISNAASLCFGICCNHPFNNGNKRTALVAMLCHLDKNGLTLTDQVSQSDLYNLMIKIADHGFAAKKPQSDASDIEVKEIALWIKRHTRKIDKPERVVTFRELKRILRGYDIELESPKGNYIDVVKYEYRRRNIFSLKKERIGARVACIPYPGDGQVVGKKVLKTVREKCKLTEKNGCDSEIFYSGGRSADFFITRYRKTLHRLAKT